MAFIDLDETRPQGTEMVSTIDNYERETRNCLRNNFMEISGFPSSSALRIQTWTTNERPAANKSGLFGYNTQTQELEYYNGSNWVPLLVDMPSIYDKARKDQNGNVIDTTYATKQELEQLENQINNLPSPSGGTSYSAGTASQLNTGTNTTSMVWSPKILHDYVGSAASAAVSNLVGQGSNYVEFNNGLIAQWGEITQDLQSFTESKTMSFTKSFTTAAFLISCSPFSGTGYVGTTTASRRCTASPISTTQFKVYGDGYELGGENQPMRYDYGGYWFAIGK